MSPTEMNGWDAWGKHVLLELERLGEKVESVDKSIGQVKIDIGQLKIKSGVFGAIGASIPVLTGLIIYFISALSKY